MSAATCVERIGTDVHLEEVLDDEVAAEVVAVAVGGTIDGTHRHEDGQHDGGLHRGGRDKGRQHQINDQETPKHTFGALAELDDEGQGQSLGELRLDQHTRQNEGKDIQPHHRVTELGQGLLLCGDITEHDTQDDEQRGQVVGNGLRHPEDETRDEDGEHGVVGAEELLEADVVATLQGLFGQHLGVQVVDETDVTAPINHDEGDDGQGAAEACHPNLKVGLLHLGQLFHFVVVHVQGIKCAHGSFVLVETEP